jgi:vacuolar protein 8
VELLRGGSAEGRVEAAGALGNLAFNYDIGAAAVVEAGAISPLVGLLRGGSDEVRAEAARALWSLAYGNDNIAAAVAEAGAIPSIVQLLSGSSDEGRVNAAGALATLAAGMNAFTAAVVAAGAIPPLIALLRNRGSTKERKFAATALFNLTSLDAGQRQVEGLGYTQDHLRELQAESSQGHLGKRKSEG